MGHPGKLVIKQRFSGIDEHGHLTIDTELEGRVPQVPAGASVHIEPYTELYHYSRDGEAPGLWRGTRGAIPYESHLFPDCRQHPGTAENFMQKENEHKL